MNLMSTPSRDVGALNRDLTGEKRENYILEFIKIFVESKKRKPYMAKSFLADGLPLSH